MVYDRLDRISLEEIKTGTRLVYNSVTRMERILNKAFPEIAKQVNDEIIKQQEEPTQDETTNPENI